MPAGLIIMALQTDFRFKPEIEFVPELNWWVRWEQDSQDPHSYSAVKLSPAVVEEMQLQGPSVDGAGADGGVDGCTDEELVSSRHIICCFLSSPSRWLPSGYSVLLHV